MRMSVVKEAPGQYAAVDWSRYPNGTASMNTVLLFRTKRDAERFVRAADYAKEA